MLDLRPHHRALGVLVPHPVLPTAVDDATVGALQYIPEKELIYYIHPAEGLSVKARKQETLVVDGKEMCQVVLHLNADSISSLKQP